MLQRVQFTQEVFLIKFIMVRTILKAITNC